jgi:hypothetical protein
MIGTTRARVSHFMNRFRKLEFIDYNGHVEVHSSLLSVFLNDQPRTELAAQIHQPLLNDVMVVGVTAPSLKATAQLMLWLAGSLLAGAVASMLGATEGGVFRDSKWYEPGWKASLVRSHI